MVGRYQKNITDPTVFPKLMSWGMVIVGTTMTVPAVAQKLRNKDKDKEQSKRFLQNALDLIKSEWKVAAFMAISVVYVFLYERLGYFITSFLAVTGVLFLFEAKKKSYFVSTYVAVTVLYVAFRFGLSAKLPLGTWFGF